MLKNTANQKWRVFAYDRTTGAAKTGDAANISAKINKDYAGEVATNDAAPTEVAHGFYDFDLLQAETNAYHLSLDPISGTANIDVIGCPPTQDTLVAVQTGDAYAVVAHADHGNAKLVRSTTPANTLTVDATHRALADLASILGTALTETAGYLAAAFKKFFNIETPALTTASKDQTGDAYAVVAHADHGNAKLVRSTTPANTLTVDATHRALADLASILGTALTETAGYLAAAFKKFFNVETPALTVESKNLVDGSLTKAKFAADYWQAHDWISNPADPIWYVATTGSDTTGDGTSAKPFLTIAKALTVATAGDIIQVGPGFFSGPVSLRQGVTLRGAGPRATHLSATGDDGDYVLTLDTDAHVEDIFLHADPEGAGIGILKVLAGGVESCRRVTLASTAAGRVLLCNGAITFEDCLFEGTCNNADGEQPLFAEIAAGMRATFRRCRLQCFPFSTTNQSGDVLTVGGNAEVLLEDTDIVLVGEGGEGLTLRGIVNDGRVIMKHGSVRLPDVLAGAVANFAGSGEVIAWGVDYDDQYGEPTSFLHPLDEVYTGTPPTPAAIKEAMEAEGSTLALTLTAATAAVSSLATVLARLGAWTGTGVNTILGALRALANKAAGVATPTDLSTGGTFTNTSDSLEALADKTGGTGGVTVLPIQFAAGSGTYTFAGATLLPFDLPQNAETAVPGQVLDGAGDPVDLTDRTLVFRVVDSAGTEVLRLTEGDGIAVAEGDDGQVTITISAAAAADSGTFKYEFWADDLLLAKGAFVVRPTFGPGS